MIVEGLVLRKGKTKAGKHITTIFDEGTACMVMTDEPLPYAVGDQASVPVRAARSKDGRDPFFFGV